MRLKFQREDIWRMEAMVASVYHSVAVDSTFLFSPILSLPISYCLHVVTASMLCECRGMANSWKLIYFYSMMSTVLLFKDLPHHLWVNVYNPSAPGNQLFCELLPRANDVINMYMTSNSTGNARFSCERSV